MALSALLGANSKCIIGDVGCDGVTRELHSLQAETTDHPVESGSDIVDHYRVKPPFLSIDGIISRTPIATGFPGQSLVNSITALVTGQDPVVNAWQAWEANMNKAERINVITGKKFYFDMVIVDLQDPRVTNDWMAFTMVLKRIRTAYTTSVEANVAVALEAATTTAQQAASAGQQAAAEAENASILATLLGL